MSQSLSLSSALWAQRLAHKTLARLGTPFQHFMLLCLSRHTPACLPPRDAKAADYIGKTASVYGWGLFKESLPCDSQEHLQPPSSTVLRETTETILSNEKCKQSSGMFPCCPYGTPTECLVCPNCTDSMMDLTDDMLCGYKSEKGACQGDSGGPLTVEADGKHTLHYVAIL